ncbi:MAG: hypothetical protein ACI81R_000038 [Bradymonadia bacterium]|jgi:hypothetical protein
MSKRLLFSVSIALLALLACDDSPSTDGAAADGPADAVDGADAAERPPFEPAPGSVYHSFGVFELEPFEETSPCVVWTLNNEQPLYVNRVVLANEGGFHHSNWFSVPDDLYAGPDGYFPCDERRFTELDAAIKGTVLFAQSTQSLFEEQAFRDGAVIKIPARSSIIAAAHLLNLSNQTRSTELRMQLDLIHPREVDAILGPIRFTYLDLDIPAGADARFSAECDLSRVGNGDIKIHWVVPHYHYLGNHFRLEVLGGPNDGDVLYELDGFNSDANGQAFDPPLELSDADGLRFTCGFYNPTPNSVGWGIGDQEMCVMLALAESGFMIDGTVDSTDSTVEGEGRLLNEGACSVIGIPQNREQRGPTDEEIAGDLYLPPSDGTVTERLEGVCVDTPSDAAPPGDTTLSAIESAIFRPSCTFSSCHGGPLSAANLDLASDGLYERLMTHSVSRPGADPLIVPGDPEGSTLYQLLSTCTPSVGGVAVPHMPLNAPELLPDASVAMIRQWIADGAVDD